MVITYLCVYKITHWSTILHFLKISENQTHPVMLAVISKLRSPVYAWLLGASSALAFCYLLHNCIYRGYPAKRAIPAMLTHGR